MSLSGSSPQEMLTAFRETQCGNPAHGPQRTLGRVSHRLHARRGPPGDPGPERVSDGNVPTSPVVYKQTRGELSLRSPAASPVKPMSQQLPRCRPLLPEALHAESGATGVQHEQLIQVVKFVQVENPLPPGRVSEHTVKGRLALARAFPAKTMLDETLAAISQWRGCCRVGHPAQPDVPVVQIGR